MPPTSGTASNGLPIYNWDQAAAQITRDSSGWGPSNITFAFRSTAPATMPTDTSGFVRFSDLQIAATLEMIALWSEVANITFTRVQDGDGYSNNATILFANYTAGAEGASAFAYYPGSTVASAAAGDVWVNYSLEANNSNLVEGAFGPHILAHEFGHAIGLAHPADYDASDTTDPTYPESAVYWQDSRMYTVMSYFGSAGPGGNLNAFSSGPQFHDIAAAQLLYGANMSTRTGDTVYGFNSNAGHAHFTITVDEGSPVFAIWDAGGNDTLDLSGYSTAVEIDLRAGAFSSAGPGSNPDINGGRAYGNISIALGVVIENGIGGSANDVLIGNDVANVLDGGAGADNMSGAGGNDSYIVDNAGDTITEAAASGADVVTASVSYTLAANVENLILAAGAANGTGNGLANAMTGNGSANNLDGGDGNDTLSGGAGDDTLNGMGGNDTLYGNDGNDILDGGAGADAMFGNFGDDIYHVDNAGDTVSEGSALGGLDQVYSSVSFNMGPAGFVETLWLTGLAAINGTGNAQDNVINANNAANVLSGNQGNDIFSGAGGNDTIYGGDGNDVIDGGTGADTMIGNFGDDSYNVDDVGDVVSEGSASGGYDSVTSQVSFNLGPAGYVEVLSLTGSAVEGRGNALDNVIVGNAAANILWGNNGADLLFANEGNDSIYGGDGNDVIDGGAGADTMIGNFGDDSYYVDDAGDVVSEGNIAGGTDTVASSITFNLGPTGYADNLTLTGAAAINGTGNSLANIIVGNTAANVLQGNAGNDTLNAGDGADTLYGGDGADQLNGGTGADTMIGNLGDDSYTVDDAGDVVSEGSASGGLDWVSASVSFNLAPTGYVENLTLTGSANINGTGNGLANQIVGNSGDNSISGAGGDDVLIGQGGADTLDGGAGADTLSGGADADSFVFSSAFGTVDAINDYSVADDTIVLASSVFTTLSAGALAASAFVIGSAAADADDRIIYDSATGHLYFDADGNAAGAQVLFAALTVGLALTSADFIVSGP
jgi:Ca2+-binding RTX toxin-like protein